MNNYLLSTQYVDWENPAILTQANALAEGAFDSKEVINKCFEFVRDEIKHSWDYQLNPVTCKASDVLKYGTGYCYAYSKLII